MSGNKTARAGLGTVAALIRSGFEVLLLLPSLLLAWLFFGPEGAVVTAIAAIPYAVLATRRNARAAAHPIAPPRDCVSGLPMREAVVAVLDQALAGSSFTGKTPACLVLCIDDAQRVVDLHGQSVHDRVLRKIGERLMSVLRDGDLVVRIEGPRFAIALAPSRRSDLEATIQMAARLQKAAQEALSIDAMSIYVTASVGFCLANRSPGAGGEALLGAAELAAEEARRNGPGAIRAFSPEIETANMERDALHDAVAVALDDGQIVAYFQPQISTDTGDVSGFEALARWRHPDRGVLLPDEFLPAVKAAGLSERLGEVMLAAALGALRDWDRHGLRVPQIGVNFAKEDLRNPKLAERVKWELDRHDLAPGRLTIEIDEGVVAAASCEVIARNLAGLSQLGCGIDLDDFGTGQASIAAIRRFGVDRLKIDPSFVTRVDADADQQRMVAAILSLAERLGLATIAEGVESIGEHAMLAQLGCGQVQGHAIARPMPSEQTEAWLELHRRKMAGTPRLSRKSG